MQEGEIAYRAQREACLARSRVICEEARLFLAEGTEQNHIALGLNHRTMAICHRDFCNSLDRFGPEINDYGHCALGSVWIRSVQLHNGHESRYFTIAQVFTVQDRG